MLVHYNIEQIPVIHNAVITIGTFDGVHVGHQKIIEQLKKEAVKVQGETVVISFHPHPRTIIHSNKKEIYILNTLEEKIELLEKTGIDHLVIIPFTDVFAQQSAIDYIKNFLIQTFHPHTIVIGYDHKFGKNREGDYTLLECLASKYNFIVKEIPQQVLQESSISSTRIREALQQCDIEKANALLGYPYFFEGKVVEGNKKGRTIDFPTANLLIENTEKLIPANGVYAVKTLLMNNEELKIKNEKYSTISLLTSHLLHSGMMNIGMRPTINGTERTIEVHLINEDINLYGKNLRVYVCHYLRSEQKFDSLEMLKKQLYTDKENALALLNKH